MIKYFQEPRLDKRRIAGKDVCIVCRSLARASPDRAPCSINVKVHQPLIDFLQLPPDYHPFSILGKVDIRAITKQPPTQTNTSRHEALHCCCLTEKYLKKKPNNSIFIGLALYFCNFHLIVWGGVHAMTHEPLPARAWRYISVLTKICVGWK